MEEENIITTLGPKLQEKSSDNVTYRKAFAIFESLIQSTKALPNYQTNIANTESNFALFVFSSAYKQIIKAKQQNNSSEKFNLDAYVLLMGSVVSKVNMGSLKYSPQLLLSIQSTFLEICLQSESTPLMIRHSIAILNLTINASIGDVAFRPQCLQIITKLFQISIENSRNNTLSKQSSKLLSILIHSDISIGKLLATEVKKNLLDSLQNRRHLYLNNVRDVIREFPIPLINDIMYRTTKNLTDVDHSVQTNEQYLAQLYFFMEKLIDKLSVSTLEEVMKELIENVPTTSTDCEKIIFCYLQALYEVVHELANKNEKVTNRCLSSVVSVFQEFILVGDKIEKHAFTLLKHLMKTCIRPSLWLENGATTMEGMLDGGQRDSFMGLGVDDMNLDGNTRKGHSFGKVICMLKSMLSSRFGNTKQTAQILCEFFESLDLSAFEQIHELIVDVVAFREELHEKSFYRVMHSVFTAFGPKTILDIYPVTLNGDIANEAFESENNLWMVNSLEKYNGEEQMEVFGQYFVPLLAQIKDIEQNSNITKVRKQAYANIAGMIWRSFKVFCKAINKRTDYESLFGLVDMQINSVNESTLDHISVGLEKLCINLYKNEYVSKISENLIKHFAASLNIEKNNSKQILQAIKALSLITKREYLNRVFEKNIVKLIEAQESKTLTTDSTINNNLKNLEILMSVCSGMDFSDPSVVSKYRVSKEELVVKLIQGLITEENIFQKKGYKFILETVPVIPESFTQQIIEMIESDSVKILPASKHYRIAILNQLWNKLGFKGISSSSNERSIEQMFNFVKAYLPEILIALKETNKRTRKEATRLFEEFYTEISLMGLVENFIEIICAGFTSERTEIKLATISGLLSIVTKKNNELEKAFLFEVFELVLMLLKDQKSDLYKAVINYSKKWLLKLEKSEQLQILPGLIQELFTVDDSSKTEERSVLKHFLLKVVKKHSREAVEKMIPADDRKILSNAIKTQNRQKKKKRQEAQIKRQKRQEWLKGQVQSGGQESSDSQDEPVADGGSEGVNLKSRKKRNAGDMMDEAQEQLEALNSDKNLLMKYDLQKENFHFEEGKLNILNEQRKDRQQKERKKNEDVAFDEDGFMVVKDDNKRRRRDEDDTNAPIDEEANANSSKQYMNIRKKVKTNVVHEVKESGEAFRSNRAGGDIRRKDQPEPYAFVQFNSKALNKRFKKKAEKIFDTIFERKQGGLKGIKSRVQTKN